MTSDLKDNLLIVNSIKDISQSEFLRIHDISQNCISQNSLQSCVPYEYMIYLGTASRTIGETWIIPNM